MKSVPSWPRSSLADVLSGIEAGVSPKALNRPAGPAETGVLKVSAVTWKEFRPQENKALPPSFNANGHTRVQKGDVLLSRANTTELLASPVMVRDDYPNLILSDKTLRLVPIPEKLDSSYLVYALRMPDARRHFEAHATGTSGSMRNISQVNICSCKILLPPLPEQRRIAAVLDQTEALRAKRRAALAKLDTLAHAIFLDMFGDPATNPRNLSQARIGDITSVGTGKTPSRANGNNFVGITPWVKTTEVNWAEIHDTAEKISDVAAAQCRQFPANSIVVALYGQGKTRGKCAILRIPAATNQACGVLLPNERYDTGFLFFQLKMSYQRLRAEGRGGNQENLNLRLLEDFVVLAPALREQQKFAQHFNRVEKVKLQSVSALTKLDALFASLQHRAFRGEL